MSDRHENPELPSPPGSAAPPRNKTMSKVREPANSPAFVLEHIRRYRNSDGAEGHMWDSTGFGDHGLIPTLLLTTTGCRSGEPMMVPLIYGQHEGDYVVVASAGGAPVHPAWYLNLAAEAAVAVQVKADKFPARARTASGKERQRLWTLMARIYPTYNDLQGKTTREIPVVVLAPLQD